MRYLLRTAAVGVAAALTVTGLSPADAVDVPPTVPLTQAGPLTAWGYDGSAVGADTGPAFTIPAQLQQRAVRAVAGDPYFTVAVTADGGVTAWGNQDAATFNVVPAPAGLSNVVAVAAGDYSALALTGDGRVTAWGTDVSGLTDVPSNIQGHVTKLDAVNDYAMALTDDGRIVQWGNNAGESGYAVPAQAADGSPVQGHVVDMAVSATVGTFAGGSRTPNLAVLDNGEVVTWGNQSLGADPTAWDVPLDIQGDVAKVVSGLSPAAILKDGTVRFWGPTASTTYSTELPVGFDQEKVTDLRISGYSAMALAQDGDVYLWGSTGTEAIDAALQPSLAGPVREGASAIAYDPTGAFVVTTGLAIGSEPAVAGTAQVGQTLTATPATFSGDPASTTTSGQWLAGGTPIADVTGTTLTLKDAYLGKQISYRSTAVNGDKTVTATSPATAAVAAVTPGGGGGTNVQPQPQPAPPAAAPSAAQKKLKSDQAKLKKLKKQYKKAHGAKKAKLKKKITKLNKAIKKDKKNVNAGK